LCHCVIPENIAAVRHIRFFKIQNFNFTSGSENQYASQCQNSSVLVKWLLRYGDVTVFRTAVVRHLAFCEIQIFLMVVTVKRPTLYHQFTVQNFVKIGQTVSEISRFFCDF